VGRVMDKWGTRRYEGQVFGTRDTWGHMVGYFALSLPFHSRVHVINATDASHRSSVLRKHIVLLQRKHHLAPFGMRALLQRENIAKFSSLYLVGVSKNTE